MNNLLRTIFLQQSIKIFAVGPFASHTNRQMFIGQQFLKGFAGLVQMFGPRIHIPETAVRENQPVVGIKNDKPFGDILNSRIQLGITVLKRFLGRQQFSNIDGMGDKIQRRTSGIADQRSGHIAPGDFAISALIAPWLA